MRAGGSDAEHFVLLFDQESFLAIYLNGCRSEALLERIMQETNSLIVPQTRQPTDDLNRHGERQEREREKERGSDTKEQPHDEERERKRDYA